MTGKKQIWEIDKAGRRIKYAPEVLQQGWVGSREEGTIVGSDITVVAYMGSDGVSKKSTVLNPKVKIETLSGELLKGLGKEVLDYAIPLIDPEAKDWELDVANNRIKYTIPILYEYSKDNGAYPASSPQGVAEAWIADSSTNLIRAEITNAIETQVCVKFIRTSGTFDTCISLFKTPVTSSPQNKSIPIDTVSQQVIANADSGHAPSKTFLKSIPLFAYLLTGSGTEAVNKAVLDIDPEATDWVLDPENNAVKWGGAAVGNPTDGGGYYVNYYGTIYYNPTDFCKAYAIKNGRSDSEIPSITGVQKSNYFNCLSGSGGQFVSHKTTGYVGDAGDSGGDYKYIPIDIVAAKVISNAEAGHTPSQEALRLSTVERVNTGEYDEALEAASSATATWKYLPIFDVAVQVKRNSIAGHAESIEAVNNSLPFVIPNYEPNVTITGIAKVGEVLTATVTDANGVPSNINYQWYANGEVISGATSETYVIKESDSGKTITVQADFTDKDGFSESVTDTVDVENVTTDIGLREDYSGTGWYKATDTGTVFNKGVPALETHVFEDSPKEYVSVYTKADAKLYGERAAVSNITNMSSVFEDVTAFNQDISSWDVSSVTDMSSMFNGASAFNFDISNWDVSSVANMRYMFADTPVFNSNISNWNVGSVTDMGGMFLRANSFNQDISMWDVSSVTDMSFMFADSASFSSDISSWDVSSVTDMSSMFNSAISFNSDISNWDVSSVVNMQRMFQLNTSFNKDLSSWCVTLIPSKPSDFDLDATAWTLPRPVWGTCPSEDVGDDDTPWAYVPEETSVTGSTTNIKAKRTFENQKLKSSISVAASASKVGEYLINGGGSDALDYAMVELSDGATEWVLDPENNRIKYTFPSDPNSGTEAEALRRCKVSAGSTGTLHNPIDNGGSITYDCFRNGSDFDRLTQSKLPPLAVTPDENYIPIDTVAQKITSNAEAGHAPSQEAVKATALEGFAAGEYDADLDSAAVIEN